MIKHTPIRFCRWAALCVLACAAWPALAEQYVQSNGYTVHYMAIQTSDLTPAVARAYGLKRSSGTALVMINTQQGALSGAAVSAVVAGEARNLTGVRKPLAFREVTDGDAIYALATAPVANLETLKFDLQVQPENSGASIPVQFSRKFYR